MGAPRSGVPIAGEGGQTMVEFALVAPVLLLIVFAAVQFGILYNHYVTLTDATRAGARKAVVSRLEPDRPGSPRRRFAARRAISTRASSTSSWPRSPGSTVET